MILWNQNVDAIQWDNSFILDAFQAESKDFRFQMQL